MTILLRAYRWLAAGWQWRHTARAAWRNGADLLHNWLLPEQQGRHRAVGERACDTIATWVGYRPRHSLDRIPDRLRRSIHARGPVARAIQLTAALGNYHWRPTRPYRTAVSW